jgi:hypothetical protein
MPYLCKLYPGICLTTEHGKTSVRVAAHISQADTVQYKNNEQYNTQKRNNNRMVWCHRIIKNTEYRAQNEQHKVIRITQHIWISLQTYSGKIANDAFVSMYIKQYLMRATFYISKQNFLYWTEKHLHKKPLDDISLKRSLNRWTSTVNCDLYVSVVRNSTFRAAETGS